MMVPKREPSLPGAANPVIASGFSESRKTPIMEFYLCQGGAPISWTPKKLFLTTVVVN